MVKEQKIDSLFGIYKAPKNRAIADIDRALDDLRRKRASNSNPQAGDDFAGTFSVPDPGAS